MAYYPYINTTGNNTILALLQYDNTVTGGLFWDLMLAAIYIVVLVVLMGRGNQFSKALASDGFFTAILAGLMFVIGLIDESALIISLVLAFAGFIMLMFSQEGS